MKKLLGMVAISAAILCSGCWHEVKSQYVLERTVDDFMKVQPVLSNMINRIQAKNMTVSKIVIWGNANRNRYNIIIGGRDNDDFVEERD